MKKDEKYISVRTNIIRYKYKQGFKIKGVTN